MKRIIVTGGAGFIGSALMWKLNRAGIDDILVVDDLGSSEKWRNLVSLNFTDYVHKDAFIQRVREDSVAFEPDAVIHLGACSSTTELDADYLMENNVRYTRDLANWAIKRGVRFIYASSAATYGDGALGFNDDEATAAQLRPLNMYGYSKSLFDLHAVRNGLTSKVVGVKFFNVFGPNEYHKGPMTSKVVKAFHEIKETGAIRLFKSDRSDYGDGEQKRDFIYVKDCVNVLLWLMRNAKVNGIYNLGTGEARSWNDLARAIFAVMRREPNIEYVEMPAELHGKYQYFTEANMGKLERAGCPFAFRSLEESVDDYISNYLQSGTGYLGGESDGSNGP